MPEFSTHLELVKNLVFEVAEYFHQLENADHHKFDKNLASEIKADADKLLENKILESLSSFDLPVLSEESGFISCHDFNKAYFIVDPLEGTFNFVRGIGIYGISIALWENASPVFGVIYDLPNRKLFWGGPEYGAYCEETPINVSGIDVIGRSVICTGFPVRMNIEDPERFNEFHRLIRNFAKVRMLGSAAMSLLMLSQGKVDYYAEDSIMLWDVGAGLAILKGAGGNFSIKKCANDWEFDVRASNGFLAIGS